MPTDAGARPDLNDGPSPVPGAGPVIALDLDGTLIDAGPRQIGVAGEALAALTGTNLDARRFWAAKREGATTRGALEALGHPPETAAAVAARWMDRIESDEWLCRDRALPGAAHALSALRSTGAVLIVLTARRRPDGARLSMASAGLDRLVDELSVVDPADAVAEKARALSAIRPIVFIGDSESDGAAASRAGVRFAAVATGQRSGEYLRARGYQPAASLRAALDGVLSAFGVLERMCQT